MNTIQRALAYISEDVHTDAERLLKILKSSGADDFTTLVALYRWTRGRNNYEAIYNGLERFFADEINRLFEIGA